MICREVNLIGIPVVSVTPGVESLEVGNQRLKSQLDLVQGKTKDCASLFEMRILALPKTPPLQHIIVPTTALNKSDSERTTSNPSAFAINNAIFPSMTLYLVSATVMVA
jgi:hypothetical protein